MRMENGFTFCLDTLDIPKEVKNLINLLCVHSHWELFYPKKRICLITFSILLAMQKLIDFYQCGNKVRKL